MEEKLNLTSEWDSGVDIGADAVGTGLGTATVPLPGPGSIIL